MANVPAEGEEGEGKKEEGISFAGKQALSRKRNDGRKGLLTLDVSKTVDSSDTISDGWRRRGRRGSSRLEGWLS